MDTTLGRLGHYQVVRRLGAGGMGEVLLARDMRLERDVAIKRLPAGFAADAQRLERFRREALVLASLNHPHIATLFGIEPAPDGSLALVMEYLAGETLAARLERGALTPEETVGIAVQIADAIEAAHGRDVVHRDLKPANVAFAAPGRVKVLDFGLARRGAAPGGAETEVEGTPGYMSPEQAMGAPQDARSDLFSFGCILFECLAGEPAFVGTDPLARVAAAMYTAAPLERLPARLPGALRELVERLLDKDPDRRPPGMREVRVALEEIAGLRRASALMRGEAAPTPHRLPAEASRFVGRERELAAAHAALGRSRLLTLTGVGGCGKSRLALALARQSLADHPDGAWWVELAPLAEGERVAERVAAALGVEERPGEAIADTLAAHFAARRLLLVLDNCEHLLGAVASLVGRWLDEAPELRVLATSREGLGLAAEQLMGVPSLSTPSVREAPEPGALARYESVQLFTDRACAVAPAFALDAANAPFVAEICRRLDGIPLALELAAARVKVLSPEQIAARLDDRFRLLTGGSRTAMPRHQTLRATLQWSHDLLHESERALFRRLAAFAGGWTLEQAVRVWDEQGDEFEVLDLLTHLVDKSLVTLDRTGEDVRYGFLETMRQFAAERLEESGETPAARGRHLAYFLELAEGAERALTGPDQVRQFAMLERELENLLAALAWSGHTPGGRPLGLRLAVAPWRFWTARGHVVLGRRVLTDALATAGEQADPRVRAHALIRLGGLLVLQADYPDARASVEASLAIARDCGDERGVARALSGLATTSMIMGDYEAARSCYEESLAGYRSLGQKRGIAVTLESLGYLAWCQGRGSESRDYFGEALAMLREIGDSQTMAQALAGLAAAALLLADHETARHQLAASLGVTLELRAEREAVWGLELSAQLGERTGHAAEAAALLEAAAVMARALGHQGTPAELRACQDTLGRLSARLGEAALREATTAGATLTFDAAIAAAQALLGRLGPPAGM